MRDVTDLLLVILMMIMLFLDSKTASYNSINSLIYVI